MMTAPLIPRCARLLVAFFFICCVSLPRRVLTAAEPVGSRFTYLDQLNPYYPHSDFPKLITPMWVGEAGVDAVILLSIDDMGRIDGNPFAKPPEEFERFLAPITERLREIDGRAPITIFTCNTPPKNACLQRLLDLGLSLECHSYMHRFPFFRSDPGRPADEALQFAKQDFVACMENLFEVPRNRPVAWRLPGCDAQNSNSPRFYSEVFPLRTSDGRFLSCDSSITTWFPLRAAGTPQQWRRDGDDRPRFAKYPNQIPQTRNFVNQIVDYPYPYPINHLIWELPITIPCDSHGVHQNGKQSDKTVDDWKRAVDICVQKQGLMNLLFHSIGYISNRQIREVVDYADRTYGGRVKFLNCREIDDRLTEHALGGVPLRSKTGGDNGVRLLDIDADGFLDVVIGNDMRRETRRWDPAKNNWQISPLPAPIVTGREDSDAQDFGVRFFTAAASGHAGMAVANEQVVGVWRYDGERWQPDVTGSLPEMVDGQPLRTVQNGLDRGVRFRDLDNDGCSDLIVNNESQNAVFRWDAGASQWRRAPFSLPQPGCLVDAEGLDQGLRFVDLDGDGDDDLVLSNEQESWVCRFEDATGGWSAAVTRFTPGEGLPPIVRAGKTNGAWFNSEAMVLQNEYTIKNRDYITRIPLEQLLRKSEN